MELAAINDQEVQQLRRETQGTVFKIHFNNAGASFPPDAVVETVINYLKEEAVNGGYETEYKYSNQLQNAYKSIAKLINADEGEIAIVENASVGWGIAFYGLDFKKGDEIITSEMEYVTNLIGLINVQKLHSVEIKVIPNDEYGNFSLQKLEEAITPQTKLIAVTHIPSSSGGMLPIVGIGKIAAKYNILYLLDACQSVGHVPLDVKEINCDMLSVTGRKYLRAPRGTGFLYLKKEIQHKLKPVFMDGHSIEWVSENDFQGWKDARRFELYEKNRALTLGLAKAVDYALAIGPDRIWNRITSLAGLFRAKLEGIEGVTVHDKGSYQCGIVTFSVAGKDSDDIKNLLSKKDINVSVGRAKSTLLFMNKNELKAVVRASVHYYNTEEEIEKFCEVLRSI